MSEETSKGAPIGLEMSRRGKIGCVVSLVVLLLLAFALSSVLRSRGRETATATSNRLYSMAQARDYPNMESIGTKSVIQTLQKAEEVNGPIQSYQVLQTNTHLVGRPSEVQVEVTRKGQPYVAVVALLDNERVAVVIEYPKADFLAGKEDHAIRVIAK